MKEGSNLISLRLAFRRNFLSVLDRKFLRNPNFNEIRVDSNPASLGGRIVFLPRHPSEFALMKGRTPQAWLNGRDNISTTAGHPLRLTNMYNVLFKTRWINIDCVRAIENTRFSPILNYSDTADFYQCPQTHLQCSPNCAFHTPNSPFAPPTVIRGKYIAVMWMHSVIILILHGSYTKSLELWNDNLIIKFDFLIGTDICSNRLAHFGNPSVYVRDKHGVVSFCLVSFR
jgi:hypothetical protein